MKKQVNLAMLNLKTGEHAGSPLQTITSFL
jgi:hypothetical protein